MIDDIYFKIKLATLKQKIYTSRNLTIPEENSTIGEQLKYYRKYNNMSITDLSKKLGISKYSIMHLENDDILLYNLDIIKAIIEEFNIKNKIKINDSYLEFLLDNPSKIIRDYILNNKLTEYKFAKKLDIKESTIKRWVSGKNNISRRNYRKIMKLVDLIK